MVSLSPFIRVAYAALIALLAAPYPASSDGRDEPESCLADTAEPSYPCTEDFLKDFWHDFAVPGFHIVCLSASHSADDEKVSPSQLDLKMFRGGMGADVSLHQLSRDNDAWENIKHLLETNLQMPSAAAASNRDFQPYALFSPEGRRLADGGMARTDESQQIIQRLLENGVFLVFAGGQWLWPGVRVGFKRTNVALYSVMPMGLESREDRSLERNVTITTLSLEPLVVSIEGFLSEQECLHIQNKAKPSMQYSEVVLMDHDAGRPASDFRTSQSTFLRSGGDPVLQDLETRVASLARIPRNQQEAVQVLRYGFSEKYDHHTDYFDPQLYKNDKATLRNIKNGARNRLATVFWYLSDVEAGGETAFPMAFGETPANMQDCTTGLLVKPELGKVIIFYSLLMTGEGDPKSMHGACPVKEGVKWAANKWIWNERMGYVS